MASEYLRWITCKCATTGAVLGVNVSAPVEKEVHDLRESSEHRAVQRRAAKPVHEVDKIGFGVEQGPDAPEPAALRGRMDRMVRPLIFVVRRRHNGNGGIVTRVLASENVLVFESPRSWLDGLVRPIVLAVLGPTAIGQERARHGAGQRFGGEIINCDSTAVYRGFDIGTDKVPAARARRHPAPPDRHRRPDRGLHRGAFAARRGARDPRHPRARAAADPGRRHRPLLPRADPRALSRARRATRRCARG